MPSSIDDLLVEWERCQSEGTPVSPERLCPGRPEVVPELRRRIDRLRACDQLLDRVAGRRAGTEPLPERIGAYEIRGVLGWGGMGVVYDGWDPGLERAAAVKVLRPSPAYQPFVRSVDLAARFERERVALGRLDHPHIVPVYQAGVSDGQAFVAMARMGGGTLADRREDLVRRGPRAIAAFMEKVARAVQAAHEQGVLHRDLKPANVLLDGNGEPKVSDFGLAKFWDPEAGRDEAAGVDDRAGPAAGDLTFPGTQPGTPAYMAPEQFDPALGPVGPFTDVWALGVVLHELVTGQRPSAAATEVGSSDVGRPSPAVRAWPVGRRAAPWLGAIATRCLARRPADRYQSAGQLADALRDGLRPRRWLFLLSAVAVLASIGIAGYAAGRLGTEGPAAAGPEVAAEPPEVTEALRRLGDGAEVTLVGEGARFPARWVLGDHTGTAQLTDDGTVRMLSRWPVPAAVELLPRLPAGRYRVEAEVRHQSGDSLSRVGVYAHGHGWEAGDGRHFRCAWIEYADWGLHADTAPVPGEAGNAFATLQLAELASGTGVKTLFRASERGAVRYSSAAFDRKPAADFRTIGLRVSPGGVTGLWGQVGFGQATPERMHRFSADGPPFPGVTQPDPNSPAGDLGGVGLLVENGWAEVRSFRVIPLSDAE